MTFYQGFCENCKRPFTYVKDNPGGKERTYCSSQCKRSVANARRRQTRQLRGRGGILASGPLVPDRPCVCSCGAALVAVGLDWMGRTVEMCAHGHEALTAIRRSA